MIRYFSSSESETEAIGTEVAGIMKNGDFLAVYGEMGSGKTVFMRGFVGALIPNARVSSPTYAILNVYESDDCVVNHFDMYRISSEDDLFSTGYEEVIRNGITVCEWSENISEYLPEKHWRLTFHKISDNQRELCLERVGE